MSDDEKLNPSEHFDDPAQVLEADLSRAGKIEVLTNWANELRLLQVAEEENMRSPPGSTSDTARLLEAVERALLSLGEDDSAHEAKS